MTRSVLQTAEHVLQLPFCNLERAANALSTTQNLIDKVHGFDSGFLRILISYTQDDRALSSSFSLGRSKPNGAVTYFDVQLMDHRRHIDPTTRLTAALLHEIGHCIDFVGEQRKAALFKSYFDPLWNDWREAVMKSDHVIGLLEAGSAPRYCKCNQDTPISVPDLQFEAAVWRNLQLSELWARSYAQYIAVKSGSHELIEALINIQDYDATEGCSTPPTRQWETDDFRSVSESIDSLFLALGWSLPRDTVSLEV